MRSDERTVRVKSHVSDISIRHPVSRDRIERSRPSGEVTPEGEVVLREEVVSFQVIR
jgi:hypothetical protein